MPDFFSGAHDVIVGGGKYIAVGRDKVAISTHSTLWDLHTAVLARSKTHSILLLIMRQLVPHHLTPNKSRLYYRQPLKCFMAVMSSLTVS